MINLIFCIDNNNLLGIERDNEFLMPWEGDNKEDLRRFKELTKSNVVVMGYNTYKSIGCKPLPNRLNVVISKNHYNEISPFIQYKFKSVEDFLNNFKLTDRQIFIIGGKSLYEKFFDIADNIYVTRIKEYKSIVKDTDKKIYLNGFEKTDLKEKGFELTSLHVSNKYVYESWNM